MKIELETRPCLVTFSNKKQVQGTFMGLFQHSYTHGDSPMAGGFKAGTVAYPIAIVEINGKMQEVRISQIEFLDVAKSEASE
ncbi:hypothetical protein EFN85_14270 [Lactococcus lactis]|uniref:Uncharacterized protein n=8 Tax=Audreyjarvisvirus TaxID=2843351 RepID=A0A1W6JLD3_9CAUD|nr:hypothetical protein [Lactococcus lactis]YP_009904994.1 hypothetical protein H1Z30_gp025 [Lactococcus phage AM1]YP_009905175.1 hypothetical protein H1Z34_gp028 [Lactococcus phage LW81]ARM66330.1 hypothetical protein AM2_025 [Lactococcus phage AM2]ARM66507.1 hypothetical protein AM3_025 [Lactococcus phage AM3]ARM67060.1 hypothetical protein AM8_025 [Lactococcus phage AM8]ARM67238.1 hypothetical protein AM9_025 [Lactococcus phage AM9]ARM67417.1 hypothetical protein AM11_025 [Lactococcus pha